MTQEEKELIGKLLIDFTKKQGKIDLSRRVTYICPYCLSDLRFHSCNQLFRVTCSSVWCKYAMM